jgi:protease-4
VPPPPPPRRDRLALAVVALIFGGLFLVLFGFLFLAYSAMKGESLRLATGPRIGVIEVKGVIGAGGRDGVEAEPVLKAIRRFQNDTDMKGVVVRIDSPGGAVAPSQEIRDELEKLSRADKHVICSLGNVAASGGFYVAMGCDRIVAEPGTLTGSIGVISQFVNVKGLLERFAVKSETVKSGRLKDVGSPFRDMTPEDRAYWQAVSDRIHAQFIRAVAEARGMTEARVRSFADGRVITGEEALELGLVDEIGNFHDAIDVAMREADLKGEPSLVYPPEDRAHFLEQLLGGLVGAVADGVRAELRRDVTRAETPGVYYLMK